MTTSLRSSLYIYLGFLPLVLFFLRFFIQWLYSERHKESRVPKIFWQLSLAGNLLLMLHFLIQIQFIFMITQVVNAVISWRNLNLKSLTPCSIKQLFNILVLACVLTSLVFISQSLYVFGKLEWQRIPLIPGIERASISSYWHILGFIGVTLFSIRFWLQWWKSEIKKESILPPIFWKISILGAAITCVYGILTKDLVLVLGHSIGLIPYVRNLLLIKQKKLV
jgi:lipid-A-disaccharide synthase-like uncharacterized protein